jgi:DNA-binding transcriptional LysR family regulator
VDPWPGVEIRHLAALDAIDSTRSFRGAADRLGYVQSAVSQQISGLERLVGARLVERARGHTGVELTEAGRVLLEHAEKILRELTAARADLASVAGEGEALRVGVFESVATRVIPPALLRLRNLRPDLQVVTNEASGDGDLFAAVASGAVDCAFADLPLLPGPFEAVELLIDPCVLLVPEDWPLAQRDQPPTLHEIAELPLAACNWRVADLITQPFRIAGIQLTPSFTFEADSAAQALVSAGFAAVIAPRLSVDPDLSGVKTLDLHGLLPARTIVLYWHRDRLHGPQLASFVEVCASVCKTISAQRAQAPPPPRLRAIPTPEGTFVEKNECRAVH